MVLPAKLEARILSWVEEDGMPTLESAPPPAPDVPVGAIERATTEYPPLSPTELFSLSNAAAVAGSPCVVIKDGWLGQEQALRVHEAALEVEQRGQMKPARMGRGEGLWNGNQSRGDSILWITDGIGGKSQLPEALEVLLQRLSDLKDSLNLAHGPRSEGLGLGNTRSVQLARYAGDGRGYVRHRDTPKNAEDSEEAERKITALYYLNPDWEASMGGQLRIHLDPEVGGSGSRDACEGGDRKWDVGPVLDRLVLFRSDLVDHEVLPAFAPRLAITLWFYGRHVGLPSVPSNLATSPTRSAPPQQLAPGDDTRDRVRPLPIPEGGIEAHAAEASIFVSVVSYRDSEAKPTVVDLFARASTPSRISVGLVWQLDLDVAEDAAMHRATPSGFEELQGGRVRSLLIPAADAAGPSWARRVAQSLWKGETYVLQIDSHTRFRPGWDSYLIRSLQRCPSFKPVLTTYPVGYELPHKIPAGETRPTLLVPDGFGPDGVLRQTGRLLARTASEPLPSSLWASGFSFSGSALLLDVPYDPGLRHCFFGEEVSMASRMYTRGWDFFAPPQTVVYHLWSRAHRPSFRQVSTREAELEEANAMRRVRRLLGGDVLGLSTGDTTEEASATWGGDSGDDGHYGACPGDLYGLGTTRSLKSFQDRVGVDFRTATVTSPDARNAFRPAADFNDSVASELEGMLGILRAQMGKTDSSGGAADGGGGGAPI